MEQHNFIKAAELQEKLNALDKIVAFKTPRMVINLFHNVFEDHVFEEMAEFREDAESAFLEYLKKKQHEYSTQFQEL